MVFPGFFPVGNLGDGYLKGRSAESAICESKDLLETAERVRIEWLDRGEVRLSN